MKTPRFSPQGAKISNNFDMLDSAWREIVICCYTVGGGKEESRFILAALLRWRIGGSI
jgi:hypothetical protein